MSFFFAYERIFATTRRKNCSLPRKKVFLRVVAKSGFGRAF